MSQNTVRKRKSCFKTTHAKTAQTVEFSSDADLQNASTWRQANRRCAKAQVEKSKAFAAKVRAQRKEEEEKNHKRTVAERRWKSFSKVAVAMEGAARIVQAQARKLIVSVHLKKSKAAAAAQAAAAKAEEEAAVENEKSAREDANAVLPVVKGA